MIAGNIALQVPLGLLAERWSAQARAARLRLRRPCSAALLLPLLIESPLVWPFIFVWGAVSYGIYTMTIIELGERFSGSDAGRRQRRLLDDVGCRRHRRAAVQALRWISSARPACRLRSG